MFEKEILTALISALDDYKTNGKKVCIIERKPVCGKAKIDIAGSIDRVICNDPATIVFWKDKTKTVVKCQDGEPYDAEKGLALAIIKKLCGNTGSYYEIFKKFVDISD